MDDSVVWSSAESICGIRCFCSAQALFWPHTLWTGLGLGIQQPTSGGPAILCPVSLAGTQHTCRIFIAHLPHCSHSPSTAEVSAVRWGQDSPRPTGSKLLMPPRQTGQSVYSQGKGGLMEPWSTDMPHRCVCSI